MFLEQVLSHKYRTWKTVTGSLTFVIIGLGSGIFGPTILDLKLLTSTTLKEISYVLPVKSGGNMIGSIICSFLLSYIDHQIIITVSIFLLSIGLFLTPFCRNLLQILIIMMLNGFFSGFLINTVNVWIIHMWGKENAPFMQLIHFSFGLGAFLGPFISEPFLYIPEKNSSYISKTLNSTKTINQIVDQSEFDHINLNDLKLKYPYYIVASFSLLISIIYLITYLCKTTNKPHPTREVQKQPIEIEFKSDENSNEIKKVFNPDKPLLLHHKVVLILLSAIFIHLIYGIELSFGSLLATFAIKSDLHSSKSTASYITSMYWGCFTFFRLFTLIMINFFTSKSMLILDLVFILIGNLILLPLGNKNKWALLIGSGLIGIGVSSVYPTLWSFLEQILPVTSKMTSVVTVFACIGELILPILIGYQIEHHPMFFLYVIALYSILSIIIFALCLLWEQIIIKYRKL